VTIAPPVQELAQAVVDAGAVPLLVLCVQEPELSLKRIAASALSDIAKHSPELAQAVVDAGAVAYLAPLVTNQDPKLKRQACAPSLLYLPLAMPSERCHKHGIRSVRP
jgi:Armadillo/beta-catenin-like repeat